MKNQKIIIPAAILLVFLVGTGGFFGGMQYQKTRRPAMSDFQAMRGQLRSGELPQGVGTRLQQGQGRPVTGEIIGKDEESITVKLPDGSSRIIFVGEETKISESTSSAKDRLTEGMQVFVVGTENPDGSMTATSVQIGE